MSNPETAANLFADKSRDELVTALIDQGRLVADLNRQYVPLERLKSICAAMWTEYMRDECCDERRLNRLIEDAGRIMLEGMSIQQLDAIGRAHKDDPIWESFK